MSSFVLVLTQIGGNKFKSLFYADSIRYSQQIRPTILYEMNRPYRRSAAERSHKQRPYFAA